MAAAVVIGPVETPPKPRHDPAEQRFMVHMHPQGYVRLLAVAAEMPFTDENADEDALISGRSILFHRQVSRETAPSSRRGWRMALSRAACTGNDQPTSPCTAGSRRQPAIVPPASSIPLDSGARPPDCFTIRCPVSAHVGSRAPLTPCCVLLAEPGASRGSFAPAQALPSAPIPLTEKIRGHTCCRYRVFSRTVGGYFLPPAIGSDGRAPAAFFASEPSAAQPQTPLPTKPAKYS